MQPGQANYALLFASDFVAEKGAALDEVVAEAVPVVLVAVVAVGGGGSCGSCRSTRCRVPATTQQVLAQPNCKEITNAHVGIKRGMVEDKVKVSNIALH